MRSGISSIPFRLLGVLVIGMLVVGCSEEVKRPNVLFIAVDDLNDWIEPLGGHPQAKTPNLQRFSEEAVTFARAYCASPGCNPSRGALLTGVHTYRSGLYSNYQDWRKIPKLTAVNTLNQHFRKNGYFTAGAGKIYHYEQVDTLGWDAYYPSIKKPMPEDNFPAKRPASMPAFKYIYNMFDWAGLPLTDSATADYKSVDFIARLLERDHDKPFFLACGIYRPHHPWYVPQSYVDRFPLDSVQLPVVLESDTTDLGPFARHELIERGGNYHRHVVQAGLWKDAVRAYLASVNYADARVGQLLDALRASKYADNTIVVLWSDHGWQLGEKNHWRKFALWENLNRSVLMVKVPKGVAGMPGGSTPGIRTSVVSLLDIYPTLADLCGLPKRDDLDGTLLHPLLVDPGKVISRPVITTYDYGSYSVRWDHWHYIRYVDDSEELYNLESDPEEWNNLAGDPEYAGEIVRLKAAIPDDPVEFPESSLIPLMEHHIAPIKSREHYFSEERRRWMERFNVP